MTEDKIQLNEFIKELDYKMWTTRGCRYNADRRLKKKSTLSLATISFLSIYVLVLSLIPFFSLFNLSTNNREYISFFSVVLSIFILVLSLLEASKEYSIKAERLYSCANSINCLMGDLKLALSTIDDNDRLEIEIKRIHDEYHRLINCYKENHESVDFEAFKLEHKKIEKIINGEKIYIGEFEIGRGHEFVIHLKRISHFLIYYIFILGPPILGGIMILTLSHLGHHSAHQ